MHRPIEIWKNSTLEEKLLWLYVVLMPFMHLSPVSFMGRKILLADTVCVLLLAVFLRRWILKKGQFTLTSLEAPLFILIFVFLLSFFNSTSKINSIAELSSLIYLIAMFFLVINIITDRNKLDRVLYIWLFVALIVALIGLSAFARAVLTNNIRGNLFLSYTPMDALAHHFPRIHSTLLISNMFFAYLHVSFIFVIILLLSGSRRAKKLILLSCILIFFAAAFFSGSRRLAGLFLSIFLVLFLFGRGKCASLAKYFSFLLFLVFLAAYIVTSIWVVFPLKAVNDKSLKTLGLYIKNSYSLHFLSPLVSIEMIKKHPVIGVGLGTYNKHFGEYVDWERVRLGFDFEAYPAYRKHVEEKTLNFDPHSLYLGTLAETGILGFLGLAYFLIKYLYLLLMRFKKSVSPGFDRIISGCIISGYIGFLLNAITIDVLSMRHFWFMMAIGLAAAGQKSRN